MYIASVDIMQSGSQIEDQAGLKCGGLYTILRNGGHQNIYDNSQFHGKQQFPGTVQLVLKRLVLFTCKSPRI